MEIIKWGMATILAVITAILGVGLAIGAMFFATTLQIMGGIAIVATFLAVYVKEKLDDATKK